MALIPEEIVIVWIAKSLICFKTFCIKKIKFLMSIHNLGFRFFFFGGVFIIECNGEVRRQPAKNAGVLAMDLFPVCGTLRRIVAHRLNVETRIGEALSIH